MKKIQMRFRTTNKFILKQLDHSLSISTCDHQQPSSRLTFESSATGEKRQRSGREESGQEAPRKSLSRLPSSIRRSILRTRLALRPVLQPQPPRTLPHQLSRVIAQFQTVKDQVRVCKLWDQQLLIHIARKSTPKFTRFPSLVLIRLVLTEIQRFKKIKINKEMYGVRTLCRTASGWPYISL